MDYRFIRYTAGKILQFLNSLKIIIIFFISIIIISFISMQMSEVVKGNQISPNATLNPRDS